MSWIGEESGGLHLPVPKELKDEAEQKAKAIVENFD
jgi:20S proteasome subunit alpha 7